MPELEPIAPAKAKEMFLAQRRHEVSEATLQGYHYRLKPFVQWCGQENIPNFDTARSEKSVEHYRISMMLIHSIDRPIDLIRQLKYTMV